MAVNRLTPQAEFLEVFDPFMTGVHEHLTELGKTLSKAYKDDNLAEVMSDEAVASAIKIHKDYQPDKLNDATISQTMAIPLKDGWFDFSDPASQHERVHLHIINL